MSKFLSVLERVPLQTSEVMPAQPYITLRVRGGSNRYSMVVPDSCEALISKHTVPGETPEKIREINGRRYAYGQLDAADHTAPVRTAANYAKQRYGLDIDVSDGPTYVDGREHNDLMFTK